MTSDDATFRLVHDLINSHLTIATAESLTGGLLCSTLVNIAGASDAVRGGVCTYATELKADILGVDRAHLARTGPVDADVAIQMAQGVRTLMVPISVSPPQAWPAQVRQTGTKQEPSTSPVSLQKASRSVNITSLTAHAHRCAPRPWTLQSRW